LFFALALFHTSIFRLLIQRAIFGIEISSEYSEIARKRLDTEVQANQEKLF
jgi:DNA modification methylase